MHGEAFVGLFAAITRRMLVQSGEVAKNATEKISAGNYKADDWVKSATQLADIAALGFVEMGENLIAGPGAAVVPITLASDPFPVPVPATASPLQRELSFTTRLSRGTTQDFIAPEKVKFVVDSGLPVGTLPSNAKEFRFTVQIAGVPSGVYVGEVTVKLKGDAVIGKVKVDIAL